MIAAIVDAIRRWGATELPCGCLAYDGRGARFSEYVSEIDFEFETVSRREYVNATVTVEEVVHQLQCDQCGAEWAERSSGARCVDFGETHDDARQRLKITSRGRVGHHEAVPVVEEGDAEEVSES